VFDAHHLPPDGYRQGYSPPRRGRLSSEEEKKVKILYINTFPSFQKEGYHAASVTGWLSSLY